MPQPLEILLAEDDDHLGLLLADYLQHAGHRVTLCKNGQLALDTFREKKFSLCLLDIMMPFRDGFSLTEEIRRVNPDIPILMISARSMKDDKLKAYTAGADDYITKPFDEEELLWKIQAIGKRVAPQEKRSVISIGSYLFDQENQLLTLQSNRRRITRKEADILGYLSQHRNRLIPREEMLEKLWGENDYFLGRSLDVFISKIRKYLADDPTIALETVFGAGFVLNVAQNTIQESTL